MKASDLVILVPMLGRPHTVAPLMESIRAHTPSAYVLFVLTETDRDVLRLVDRAGHDYITLLPASVGDYARKINEGVRYSTQPLIFMGACDLRFHPGWFDAACAKLAPGIGVVGTNDMGSPRVIAGNHSTHSLITRAYVDEHGTIDEPGKALHEGYVHEFVDDELVGTALHRGAYAHAHEALVEHMHPDWGKNPTDALYQAQRDRMRASRALYRTRSALWA